MVVGVARGVHHVERLVADKDLIARIEFTVPTRVVGVGVQRRVEGVEDGIELGDVVAVLVGQHDRIEGVGSLGDGVDDAVPGARIDEDCPIALGQIGVAGEDIVLMCDICYVAICIHLMEEEARVNLVLTQNQKSEWKEYAENHSVVDSVSALMSVGQEIDSEN